MITLNPHFPNQLGFTNTYGVGIRLILLYFKPEYIARFSEDAISVLFA